MNLLSPMNMHFAKKSKNCTKQNTSPKTEKELGEIILSFKPDIAHIHNVYPLITPIAYKVLHDNKIPIVQTLHNYRFICPNGLFFNYGEICTKCLDKGYYQCGFNKCYHDSTLQSFWYADVISKGRKWFDYIDKFVSLNQFVKDMMVKKGFSENKICIIPNFTYTKPFESEKEDYFLYIGRFSKEKGIDVLLEASKIYSGDAKIYFAGTGNIEKVVNYGGKVKYVGFLELERKTEFISKAKAVIVPSTWYENFPTVVLESLSLGTPAIASKIGGLQSMVSNGENGLLFEPGNAADLASKMNYLDNDSEAKRMSVNARKTYEEKFTPEIHYKNLMELYQEII